MKKPLYSLVLIILLFSYLIRVSAQSVQTPKEGREVFCDTVITEFTPQQIIDYKNADISYINSNNLDAIIIGDPTKKYNCHFYALYLSENPDSYHRFTMPASEIYKYLEQQRNGDGSYLPSSDTLLADKIIKGNIDDLNNGTHHSMTWDPDPNSNRDWVSKSDERSLVKHAKRDSPYNEGGNYLLYHHYAKTTNIDWKNPIINGPELICTRNSTTTYSVDINPHFYMGIPSITDPSKFDSFSYSQENKTITIDPKVDSYGRYTISVEIINGAGIDTLIKKHINLGSDPHIPYNTLQGPFCMCAWESYYIYTINTSGYNFSWQFMYGSIQDMYKGSINVTPYMDGGYLTLTTTNECYPTEPTLSSYTGYVSYPACGYCPDYYRVYPNPASEVVYIEITEKALERVEKAKIVMENLSPKEVANINLPDLEDYKFTLLNKLGEVKMSGRAQNGKVTLNISHLSRGAYFIVIDTGIKPETHELIIN